MSWQQYRAIVEENVAEARRELTEPPVACPNDGTVLDTGPRGELHCPFDGWIWNGSNGQPK